MNRVIILTILIAMGTFVIALLMKEKDSETKQATGFVRSFSKAGAPDQMEQTEIDDFENSKMVSEGSQFGVQYFNDQMYN